MTQVLSTIQQATQGLSQVATQTLDWVSNNVSSMNGLRMPPAPTGATLLQLVAANGQPGAGAQTPQKPLPQTMGRGNQASLSDALDVVENGVKFVSEVIKNSQKTDEELKKEKEEAEKQRAAAEAQKKQEEEALARAKREREVAEFNQNRALRDLGVPVVDPNQQRGSAEAAVGSNFMTLKDSIQRDADPHTVSRLLESRRGSPVADPEDESVLARAERERMKNLKIV